MLGITPHKKQLIAALHTLLEMSRPVWIVWPVISCDVDKSLDILQYGQQPQITVNADLEGEYQTRCARGACAVWVLGLFRRPFHPEPIRGNGNASEPSRYHLQLLSP